MTLIAVCTIKGSVGATTTAVGLAATLPATAGAVLAECDPSGGELAVRYGLSAASGLMAAAGAARRFTADEDRDGFLARYAQMVTVGHARLEVVAASPGARQARTALRVLAEHPRLVDPPGRVVVADCGRLDDDSTVWPLLVAASVVLVVASGTAASVARLLDAADWLTRAARGRIGLVLAPGGVYGTDTVAGFLADHTLGLPIVGELPYDPRAARALDTPGPRRGRRSRLETALRGIAETVYTRPATQPAPSPAQPAVAAKEGPR